jgi:hypothetical protein
MDVRDLKPKIRDLEETRIWMDGIKSKKTNKI